MSEETDSLRRSRCQQTLPPARAERSRSHSRSLRGSTSTASSCSRSVGSIIRHSTVITPVGSQKKRVTQGATTLSTSSMLSTTKMFNKLLIGFQIPMSDKGIMHKLSCLTEKDCGAKWSTKLQKNFACATKGSTTKFMIIKGLSKETSETEEQGLITTSDISVVFQICSRASKDLEPIVLMYDYNTAFNIPVLRDSVDNGSTRLSICYTIQRE
jgi:hypothetical protein